MNFNSIWKFDKDAKVFRQVTAAFHLKFPAYSHFIDNLEQNCLPYWVYVFTQFFFIIFRETRDVEGRSNQIQLNHLVNVFYTKNWQKFKNVSPTIELIKINKKVFNLFFLQNWDFERFEFSSCFVLCGGVDSRLNISTLGNLIWPLDILIENS